MHVVYAVELTNKRTHQHKAVKDNMQLNHAARSFDWMEKQGTPHTTLMKQHRSHVLTEKDLKNQ